MTKNVPKLSSHAFQKIEKFYKSNLLSKIHVRMLSIVVAFSIVVDNVTEGSEAIITHVLRAHLSKLIRCVHYPYQKCSIRNQEQWKSGWREIVKSAYFLRLRWFTEFANFAVMKFFGLDELHYSYHHIVVNDIFVTLTPRRRYLICCSCQSNNRISRSQKNCYL